MIWASWDEAISIFALLSDFLERNGDGVVDFVCSFECFGDFDCCFAVGA